MNAWNTTNTSISQSAVRQAMFPHRSSVMKLAVCSAGSYRKWTMMKWASASTNSPRPVSRIRYQTASSKPPPGRALPERVARVLTTDPAVNGGATPIGRGHDL